MTCGVTLGCEELLLRLVIIGLSNGAVLALNAIGVTLVYGVVRIINFAHGDLFSLATVLAVWSIASLGLGTATALLPLAVGLPLAFAASVGGGTALNLLIERTAFRPFRGGSRIAPLIATIGISFMLYQVALLLRYVTNRYIPGEHRSVPWVEEFPRLRIPSLLPDVNLLAGTGLQVALPLSDALMPLSAALLALLVGLFLGRTRVGRSLQACAQDPEMAQLCGVNLTRSIQLAFALGGALAGAAAFIYALYYTHPFSVHGAQSGLLAFTAAVLGGIGRPRGALLAGLLLGVLAAFSDYFLAAQWTPVLLLSILMLLMLLRPTGLAAEGQDAVPPPVVEPRALPHRASRIRRALPFGALALALLVPPLDAALDARLLLLITGALIWALLALGLNMVLGYAGLLDLGYAACFAVGAYAAGVITMAGGPLRPLGAPPLDFLLVLALCGGIGALFGAANAGMTLRLRGEYLAIVTVAFGQIVPQAVLNLDTVTGGAAGMAGLPPAHLLGLQLGSPAARYYLALTLVALIAAASLRLRASRIGRAWSAMAADEEAAASCGIDVARMRLLVFVLGAGIAGVAGALFTASFSYVDPTQGEFRLSAMALAMVVIGGAGSVGGTIVAALAVAGYDLLALPLLGAWAERSAQAPGLEWLSVFDLRSINFLSFGLALYIAVLLRARRRT